MRAFIGFALVALASAQNFQEEQHVPVPYKYAYKVESTDGSHDHQQTSDGNGRVDGSYSLNLADGRQRIVNYWADESGFHAHVSTNELGTESQDAADAKYTSSAITGEQAAVQYGPTAPVVAKTANVVPAPAPVVKVVQAPTPVVKFVQTPTPVVKVAAPVATYVKTIQAAPVVNTYAAAHPVAVVKTAIAPAVVKTVHAAPAQFAFTQGAYAYNHAPVAYAHAPVAYAHASPIAYAVASDFHKAAKKSS